MNNKDGSSTYKSVVQLSEECMRRLELSREQIVGGSQEIPKEEKKEDILDDECRKGVKATTCVDNDCDMMEQLHCIDEKHTVEHGITKEDFEYLFQKVYNQTHVTYKMPCSGAQLVKCLQTNPKCSIKCRDYARSFIECVDRERVIKIRNIMEEEMRKERERNEEELKRLLAKKC